MASLATEVASTAWYHTIELPDGIVTPGYYDLRRIRDRVGIPDSIAGAHCLDIGSADGFWAFELERRGAERIVSLDLDEMARQDWQGPAAGLDRTRSTGRARTAFNIASRALDSRVQRVDGSIYDVAALGLGCFDLVFIGSLLLHLADPVRALEAARGMLASPGQLVSFEPISPLLSLLLPHRPVAALHHGGEEARWWTPNVAAHRRWLASAELDVVAHGGPVRQPFGEGFPRRPPIRSITAEVVRFWLVYRGLGVPSMWARGCRRGAHP